MPRAGEGAAHLRLEQAIFKVEHTWYALTDIHWGWGLSSKTQRERFIQSAHIEKGNG